MLDSCTTPSCGLAVPQCPVCNRRFVSQAQEVCATCGPWACESCGKRSSFAYKKTKSPEEIATEIQILMGYGATIGRCLKCETIKPTGDMGICRECILKKVQETELVCENCLHETSSEWLPNSRYPDTCMDCGEEKLTNEEHLCKRCFDKMIRHSLGYAPERRCWNCQENFTVSRVDQHFCKTCSPNCFGCDGKFDPVTRDEQFCKICLDRLSIHQCTNCGTDSMFLNERGHCSTCVDYVKYPRQPYFCVVCEVNEVDTCGQVCNGCKYRIKKCPRCYENDIEAKEYICDKCKQND